MDLKLRTISIFLILSFFFQEISFALTELKPIEVNFFKKPILDFKIPESIASIEDSWESSDSGKLIYLIQDAHTNNSGQNNLSKALDILLTENKKKSAEEKINYVFVEAGVGNDSLSFLRRYSSLKERKRIAEAYLRKGLLHGEEYLDLTSDHKFTLWGVEDMGLYLKAVDNYRFTANERERFENYLKRIEQTINTLKPRIYNPLLLSFEEKRSKFLKEEIPLTDYMDTLLRQARDNKIDLNSYPHLKALNNLKEKEKAIDFKLANEEQTSAVQSLSSEDREELGGGVKSEKLTGFKYKEVQGLYSLLEEKLKDSERYPNLKKYFQYLRESKDLRPPEILSEKKLLEEAVLNALSVTEDEKTLLISQKQIHLLSKLFNLILTPEEYTSYKEIKDQYSITVITGFLNKKIMDLKAYYERAVFLEEGHEEMVKTSEEFYETTFKRDEKFIENMLKKMGGDKRGVLITGGFHAPSLKALLKQRSISYISLTPQVTHETNQKRYEELLLNQKINFQTIAPSSGPGMARLPMAANAEWGKEMIQIISQRPMAGAVIEQKTVGARLADPGSIVAELPLMLSVFKFTAILFEYSFLPYLISLSLPIIFAICWRNTVFDEWFHANGMGDKEIREWLRARGINPDRDYLDSYQYANLLKIVKDEALKRSLEAGDEMVNDINAKMAELAAASDDNDVEDSVISPDDFIQETIGHDVMEDLLGPEGSAEGLIRAWEKYGANGMSEEDFIKWFSDTFTQVMSNPANQERLSELKDHPIFKKLMDPAWVRTRLLEQSPGKLKGKWKTLFDLIQGLTKKPNGTKKSGGEKRQSSGEEGEHGHSHKHSHGHTHHHHGDGKTHSHGARLSQATQRQTLEQVIEALTPSSTQGNAHTIFSRGRLKLSHSGESDVPSDWELKFSETQYIKRTGDIGRVTVRDGDLTVNFSRDAVYIIKGKEDKQIVVVVPDDTFVNGNAELTSDTLTQRDAVSLAPRIGNIRSSNRIELTSGSEKILVLTATAARNRGIAEPALPEAESEAPEAEEIPSYLTDMLAEAGIGEYRPTQHRDREITATIQALMVEDGPNSVFYLGKGGTGKTAVAEDIALQIAEGRSGVPKLDRFRVFKLNSGALKKALQDNPAALEDLMKFISERETILIIDEFHKYSGRYQAGPLESFYDDIKEATARGKLRILAMTTDTEYNKFVSYDEALVRRFTNLKFEEPTLSDTIDIVMDAVPRIQEKINEGIEDPEKHIVITEEAVEAAVELCDRALPYEARPGKDLKVLKQAASLVNTRDTLAVKQLSIEKKIILEELARLTRSGHKLSVRIRAIRRIKVALKRYLATRRQIEAGFSREVTREDVVQVLRNKGIPENVLQDKLTEKIRRLPEYLEANLKGQPQVLGPVSKAISRSYVNRRRSKPIASFFLAGPSGSGKTELAKLLARFLFDEEAPERHMIFFPGANLAPSHSDSQIIGSPPGFVGSEDNSKRLGGKIKDNPFSVVVIDEADKINETLLRTVFLTMLDEGKIVMANGEVVDCSNVIFIFTSNLGMEHGDHLIPPEDFIPVLEERVTDLLSDHGRHHEALGRYGEILFFNYLRGKDARDIAQLKMDALAKEWNKKKIDLVYGVPPDDEDAPPSIETVQLQDVRFRIPSKDVKAMDVDVKGNLYWVSKDDSGLWLQGVNEDGTRRKLKGLDRVKISEEGKISGLEVIVTPNGFLRGFVVSFEDKGVIFYNAQGKQIQSLDHSAKRMVRLGDKIYLLDQGSGKIDVIDLDGKLMEDEMILLSVIASDLTNPDDFSITHTAEGALRVVVHQKASSGIFANGFASSAGHSQERDKFFTIVNRDSQWAVNSFSIPELPDEEILFEPSSFSVYPDGRILMVSDDPDVTNMLTLSETGDIVENALDFKPDDSVLKTTISEKGNTYIFGDFGEGKRERHTLLLTVNREEVPAVRARVTQRGYKLQTGIRSMNQYIDRTFGNVLTELFNPSDDDAEEVLEEGDQIQFFVTPNNQLAHRIKKNVRQDLEAVMDSKDATESIYLKSMDAALKEGTVDMTKLGIILEEEPVGIVSSERFRMRENLEFESKASFEAATNDPKDRHEAVTASVMGQVDEWFGDISAQDRKKIEKALKALVRFAGEANMDAAFRKAKQNGLIVSDLARMSKNGPERENALELADGKKDGYPKRLIRLYLGKDEIQDETPGNLYLKIDFDSSQLPVATEQELADALSFDAAADADKTVRLTDLKNMKVFVAEKGGVVAYNVGDKTSIVFKLPIVDEPIGESAPAPATGDAELDEAITNFFTYLQDSAGAIENLTAILDYLNDKQDEELRQLDLRNIRRILKWLRDSGSVLPAAAEKAREGLTQLGERLRPAAARLAGIGSSTSPKGLLQLKGPVSNEVLIKVKERVIQDFPGLKDKAGSLKSARYAKLPQGASAIQTSTSGELEWRIDPQYENLPGEKALEDLLYLHLIHDLGLLYLGPPDIHTEAGALLLQKQAYDKLTQEERTKLRILTSNLEPTDRWTPVLDLYDTHKTFEAPEDQTALFEFLKRYTALTAQEFKADEWSGVRELIKKLSVSPQSVIAALPASPTPSANVANSGFDKIFEQLPWVRQSAQNNKKVLGFDGNNDQFSKSYLLLEIREDGKRVVKAVYEESRNFKISLKITWDPSSKKLHLIRTVLDISEGDRSGLDEHFQQNGTDREYLYEKSLVVLTGEISTDPFVDVAQDGETITLTKEAIQKIKERPDFKDELFSGIRGRGKIVPESTSPAIRSAASSGSLTNEQTDKEIIEAFKLKSMTSYSGEDFEIDATYVTLERHPSSAKVLEGKRVVLKASVGTDYDVAQNMHSYFGIYADNSLSPSETVSGLISELERLKKQEEENPRDRFESPLLISHIRRILERLKKISFSSIHAQPVPEAVSSGPLTDQQLKNWEDAVGHDRSILFGMHRPRQDSEKKNKVTIKVGPYTDPELRSIEYLWIGVYIREDAAAEDVLQAVRAYQPAYNESGFDSVRESIINSAPAPQDQSARQKALSQQGQGGHLTRSGFEAVFEMLQWDTMPAVSIGEEIKQAKQFQSNDGNLAHIGQRKDGAWFLNIISVEASFDFRWEPVSRTFTMEKWGPRNNATGVRDKAEKAVLLGVAVDPLINISSDTSIVTLKEEIIEALHREPGVTDWFFLGADGSEKITARSRQETETAQVPRAFQATVQYIFDSRNTGLPIEEPLEIVFDEEGDLHFSDIKSGNHYTRKGDVWSTVSPQGASQDLRASYGFLMQKKIVDPKTGDRYSIAVNGPNLVVHDTEGQSYTVGSKGNKPGEFDGATKLTFDRAGNLYVTERWNHRIQVRNAKTGEWHVIGKYGPAPGAGFNMPWDVAIGPDGLLYVTDRNNRRIQVFKIDGLPTEPVASEPIGPSIEISEDWQRFDREIEAAFKEEGRAYYDIGSYHTVDIQRAYIVRLPVSAAKLEGKSLVVKEVTKSLMAETTLDNGASYQQTTHYIFIDQNMTPQELITRLSTMMPVSISEKLRGIDLTAGAALERLIEKLDHFGARLSGLGASPSPKGLLQLKGSIPDEWLTKAKARVIQAFPGLMDQVASLKSARYAKLPQGASAIQANTSNELEWRIDPQYENLSKDHTSALETLLYLHLVHDLMLLYLGSQDLHTEAAALIIQKQAYDKLTQEERTKLRILTSNLEPTDRWTPVLDLYDTHKTFEAPEDQTALFEFLKRYTALTAQEFKADQWSGVKERIKGIEGAVVLAQKADGSQGFKAVFEALPWDKVPDIEDGEDKILRWGDGEYIRIFKMNEGSWAIFANTKDHGISLKWHPSAGTMTLKKFEFLGNLDYYMQMDLAGTEKEETATITGVTEDSVISITPDGKMIALKNEVLDALRREPKVTDWLFSGSHGGFAKIVPERKRRVASVRTEPSIAAPVTSNLLQPTPEEFLEFLIAKGHKAREERGDILIEDALNPNWNRSRIHFDPKGNFEGIHFEEYEYGDRSWRTASARSDGSHHAKLVRETEDFREKIWPGSRENQDPLPPSRQAVLDFLAARGDKIYQENGDIVIDTSRWNRTLLRIGSNGRFQKVYFEEYEYDSQHWYTVSGSEASAERYYQELLRGITENRTVIPAKPAKRPLSLNRSRAQALEIVTSYLQKKHAGSNMYISFDSEISLPTAFAIHPLHPELALVAMPGYNIGYENASNSTGNDKIDEHFYSSPIFVVNLSTKNVLNVVRESQGGGSYSSQQMRAAAYIREAVFDKGLQVFILTDERSNKFKLSILKNGNRASIGQLSALRGVRLAESILDASISSKGIRSPEPSFLRPPVDASFLQQMTEEFFIPLALAQGARFSSNEKNLISVNAESGESQIFSLKIENKKLGISIVRGKRAEEIQEFNIKNREVSNTGRLAAQDLRTAVDTLSQTIENDLASVFSDSKIKVALQVRLSILPEDKLYFESYLRELVRALDEIKQENPQARFFTLSREDLERLKPYWDSNENPGMDREFARQLERIFKPEVPSEARKVSMITGDFTKDDSLNVPFAQLSAGDLPAFKATILLALAAGLIDPTNIPTGFRNAWATLSRKTDLENNDIQDILNQKISDKIRSFALLPVLAKLNISEVLSYFRMGARMSAQAA